MASLLTIPPELLLLIISRLSPTSYTPLLLTSQRLSSFFSTHAAAICNSAITNNYALECAVLRPIFVDGWLVPSLACIRDGEANYMAEKARRDERDRKAIEEFRFASLGLGSQTLWASDIYGREARIGTAFTQQAARSEREKEWMERLRLSRPGPQFLAFLQMYGREIRVRVEMEVQGFEEMSMGEVIRKLDERGSFDGALRVYCVKGFLERLGEWVREIGDGKLEDEKEIDPKLGRRMGRRARTFRERIRGAFVGCKAKLKGWRVVGEGNDGTTLLFGEVAQQGSSRIEEKDSFGTGLWWYYGRSGIAPLDASMVGERKEHTHKLFGEVEKKEDIKVEIRPCSDRGSLQNCGVAPLDAGVGDTKKMRKARSCVHATKERIKRTGALIGKAARRCRCLTMFRLKE